MRQSHRNSSVVHLTNSKENHSQTESPPPANFFHWNQNPNAVNPQYSPIEVNKDVKTEFNKLQKNMQWSKALQLNKDITYDR